MSEPLATRTDIEDHYGKANLRKWADLEGRGDPAHVASRVARALDHAHSLTEARLRRSAYVLPLTGETGLVAGIEAALAGAWLRESRGVEDGDETFSAVRDEALDLLERIAAGALLLACQRRTGTMVGPAVVND